MTSKVREYAWCTFFFFFLIPITICIWCGDLTKIITCSICNAKLPNCFKNLKISKKIYFIQSINH